MNHSSTLSPTFSINRSPILRGKFSLKLFWVLSLILLVSLSLFYIFQLNKMTGEFFLISNCEKQITKLSQQSKILEINFFRNNALENAEDSVKNLSFEKVEKIHYIQVMEGTVVKK